MSDRRLLARWRYSDGMGGLLRERPYLYQITNFLNDVAYFLEKGQLSEAGARGVMLLAQALVRGVHHLLTNETRLAAQIYLARVHVQLREVEGVMGALFHRRRTWRLPRDGKSPLLLYGAIAARERLRLYDPTLMSRGTTTDVERDLRLILKALRWGPLDENPATVFRDEPAESGPNRGGNRSGGIEGRPGGLMG